MTPDAGWLLREFNAALEAEARSEEQLRELVASVDEARSPAAVLTPADTAKLVSAALALNARLRERRLWLEGRLPAQVKA